MKTIQVYIDEQEKKASEMRKEIDILRASGLVLFVTHNEHGGREFETRDYSLADRVEIEYYGKYGADYDLIQFMHDVKTSQGDLVVYCRHDKWHADDKRYAQTSSSELPHNTKRHDVQTLLKFYREKSVKKELLEDLKEKIEQFYKKPTLEELDLLDLEEESELQEIPYPTQT